MTTDYLSLSLTEFCPFCELHYKIMRGDDFKKIISKDIDSLLIRYRDSLIYCCKMCELYIIVKSNNFINQIIFKNNNDYIGVKSCITWYSNFDIYINTSSDNNHVIYDKFPRDELNIKDFVNYIKKYIDNQIFI